MSAFTVVARSVCVCSESLLAGQRVEKPPLKFFLQTPTALVTATIALPETAAALDLAWQLPLDPQVNQSAPLSGPNPSREAPGLGEL